MLKLKDEAIHILAESKDDLLKSKDETLKSTDALLKSKDEAIHILAESTDALLKSKDEAIHILAESKDETLKSTDALLKSKDETLKSTDALLKSKDEMLSAANADILYLQGRLSLRSVFEQFEQRYEGFLDTSISTKGITRREKLWKAIIENNAGGIKQYLGDTTTDWPSVAQSLYKLISKDVHNFDDFSKKVIINEISFSYEMTNLAVTLCKMFPIKYKIISPSSLDQEESIIS
jgi:hypothetical protein